MKNLFKYLLGCFVILFCFLESPQLINTQAQSSTGRLLGYEQIRNSYNNTTTTLVSIDQTTGVTTAIGGPVENSTAPGLSFNSSTTALDPANHRIFFWTQYFGGSLNGQNFMVVQYTQTGAVLAQLPTDDNFQQNYQYETITEIPPSLVSAINAERDTKRTIGRASRRARVKTSIVAAS